MKKCTKSIFSIVNQYNIPIYRAKVFIVNNKRIYCNYTDPSGLIIFPLDRGCYKLSIEKDGYVSRQFNIKILNSMEFAKLSLNCVSKSKICGKIDDIIGKPINEATVVLYYLTEDGDLIPIKHTKTLKSGVYSFINVPNGNYIIKAIK